MNLLVVIYRHSPMEISIEDFNQMIIEPLLEKINTKKGMLIIR